VAVIVASLALPWWGTPGGEERLTGIGDFGFVEGAILLTAGAALVLVLRVAGGYVPPRPLREWALLVAGGAWAALIVAYRMFDRPELAGGGGEPYQLGYGIVLALAGAALIVAAGLRRREPEAGPDG
jgi:hypothetical protein